MRNIVYIVFKTGKTRKRKTCYSRKDKNHGFFKLLQFYLFVYFFWLIYKENLIPIQSINSFVRKQTVDIEVLKKGLNTSVWLYTHFKLF